MDRQDTLSPDLASHYEIALNAIKTGMVRKLSELLRDHSQLSCYRTEQGRTLLNCVADWPGHWPRRLESAALLIDAGADINARAGDINEGETTLQWAVSCNDAALTELLIQAGSPVNGLNDNHRPMMHALFYESKDSAAVLIRHGAAFDLESAAGLGRIDVLSSFFDDDGRLLPSLGMHYPPVSNPLPPNDISISELLEQALVYAAINGQIAAAGYLIDRGADPNAIPSGFTHKIPLLAWARHHPDMVDFLIQRGAVEGELNDSEPCTHPPHFTDSSNNSKVQIGQD
jgi:uncharacterized protein